MHSATRWNHIAIVFHDLGHLLQPPSRLECNDSTGVCKTEILFYLNGVYQDKKVTSLLHTSNNVLRQGSLLVGSDAAGLNPFVGDLSSITVAALALSHD